MKSILELKNIYFKYPDGTYAINGLSLDIQTGKKIAVLGANGSGKTTLFLLLNGIHKISSGELIFKEKLFSYNAKSMMVLRKTVGIVFQDPDTQIFSSSVLEEISFGLVNLGLNKETVQSKIESVVQELNIGHLINKPTHLLSYGEKKRVSIASILAMEPEVLIMDEPTSGLDPKESTNLIHLMNDINASGKTIILSTHNVDLAYSWADQIIVIKEGKALRTGNPCEIFRDESLLKESHLEKPIIEEMIQYFGVQNYFKKMPRVQKQDLVHAIKKNATFNTEM